MLAFKTKVEKVSYYEGANLPQYFLRAGYDDPVSDLYMLKYLWEFDLDAGHFAATTLHRPNSAS